MLSFNSSCVEQILAHRFPDSSSAVRPYELCAQPDGFGRWEKELNAPSTNAASMGGQLNAEYVGGAYIYFGKLIQPEISGQYIEGKASIFALFGVPGMLTRGAVYPSSLPPVFATWPSPALRKSLRAVQFEVLFDAIERWRRLPVDWDGDDGVPPSASSCDAAQDFLTKVRDNTSAKLPTPYVTGDGDIEYLWRNENGDIASIVFLGEQEFVAFASADNERVLSIDSPYSSVDMSDVFVVLENFR